MKTKLQAIAIGVLAATTLVALSARADCVNLASEAYESVEAHSKGIPLNEWLITVGQRNRHALYENESKYVEAVVGAYETEWTAEEYGRNVQQACQEQEIAAEAAYREKMRWLHE